MARRMHPPMAMLTVDPDHVNSRWWPAARKVEDPEFRSLLRVLETDGGVECPLADAERFVARAATIEGWA